MNISVEKNKYPNEEVTSEYAYFSGYRDPKPVLEQIKLLKTHNWGKEIDWKLNELQQKMAAQKPPQGEGWGVIVFDQSLITHHEENPEMDYGIPMQKIVRLIERRRGALHDWREGQWSRQYYRRSTKLTESMKALWITQGSPAGIMLVPFQFGLAHVGRSVRRAREVMINEFGLGAYEVFTFILTHPERMIHYEDLWIDCAGDEYGNKNGIGDFDHALYVEFDHDKIKIGARHTSHVSEDYGSASGFLI